MLAKELGVSFLANRALLLLLKLEGFSNAISGDGIMKDTTAE